MIGIGVVRGNRDNPYNWFDYKWGGFGIKYWHVFPDIHPKNVFEHDHKFYKNGRRSRNYWARVWDNDKQVWRKIKTSEYKKLPILKQPGKTVSIKRLAKRLGELPVIMMPVIRQTYPELITTDIISVQPMQGPIPPEFTFVKNLYKES